MVIAWLSSALIILLFSKDTIGQANGAVRLWRTGGASLSFTSGRVQVRYNNQWGNICDDGSFGISEATVICHQLGYTGASSYSRASNDTFGINGRPTLLSNVSCSTSSYLVILQCSYDDNPPSSCTDDDDVSVTCFATRIWDNPYSGQVRLTGGDTVNEGLVEVYCNGEWGTVCDDRFNQVDADTVCRQLGYYSARDYDHLQIVGSDSQSIWIDDFPCTSRQPCIGNCISCPSINITNCKHNEDVTIECYSPLRYTETTNETCVTPNYRNDTIVDVCNSTLDDQRLQLMRDNGRCDPYHGPISSEISCDAIFREGVDYVYVPNSRERGNQVSVREFIERLASVGLGFIMSNQACFNALSRAICVHYYLPCGSNGTIHVPQFLCPEVCDYLVNDVCRTEWPLLISNFKLQVASDRLGLDLPICNDTSQIISYLNLSNDCCSNAGIVVPSPSSTPSSSYQSSTIMITSAPTPDVGAVTIAIISSSIAGSVIMLVALSVTILVIILFLKSKKRKMVKQMNSQSTSSDSESNVSSGHNYIGLRSYDQQKDKMLKDTNGAHLPYMKALTDFIIPMSRIELSEILGKGEFGVVYKGILLSAGGTNTSKSEYVAVKTLKDGLSSHDTEAIMEESLKMKHFDHLNVLKLVGVCVDTGSAPYIIMPLMSHGSLLSYLVKERHNLTVAESSDIELVSSVQKQLLSMCLQISEGMAYLASQYFVHRDLAARNCMVAANGVIKVADFGLTEDMYQRKYFRQESNVRLPIKWMAIESIHDLVFSEKSDVWSFGVTCWEVFSLGRSPYPAMGPTEVVDYLNEGSRLKIPNSTTCSEETYEMMLSCWKDSPQDRPTFDELVQTLSDILKPLANYMDFTDVYSKIDPPPT